jgi:hypothetical protein
VVPCGVRLSEVGLSEIRETQVIEFRWLGKFVLKICETIEGMESVEPVELGQRFEI